MTRPNVNKAKFKEGDECRLRGNDFMWCRVRRLLPKGLVECECSSSRDFSFGLIKTFKARDLYPLGHKMHVNYFRSRFAFCRQALES